MIVRQDTKDDINLVFTSYSFFGLISQYYSGH